MRWSPRAPVGLGAVDPREPLGAIDAIDEAAVKNDHRQRIVMRLDVTARHRFPADPEFAREANDLNQVGLTRA